jgi:hypothetical protein
MDRESMLLFAARMRLVEEEVPNEFSWREAAIKTFLGWLLVLFLSALWILPFAHYTSDSGISVRAVVAYCAAALLAVFLTQAGRAYQAGRSHKAAVIRRFNERNASNSWPPV